MLHNCECWMQGEEGHEEHQMYEQRGQGQKCRKEGKSTTTKKKMIRMKY